MKDKCPGSGRKPERIIEPGYGVCPYCPSGRRLRADGRVPAHQWTAEDQQRIRQSREIVAELWSLFGRRG